MVLKRNKYYFIIIIWLGLQCQSIPNNIDVRKDADGNIIRVVLYNGLKDTAKEFEIYSFTKNGNIESWRKVNERTDIAKVVKYYEDGAIRLAAEYFKKEQFGTLFDYSNMDSSPMRIRKYNSENMSVVYNFHDRMYVNMILVLDVNGKMLYSEKYELDPYELYTVGDTAYAKFIDRKYDFDGYILDEKSFGVWNNKVRKLKDIKIHLVLD